MPNKNLALQLVCEGGLPGAPLLASDSRQPGLARLTLMQGRCFEMFLSSSEMDSLGVLSIS